MKRLAVFFLLFMFGLAHAATYSVTSTSASANQQINAGLTSVTVTNNGSYVVTIRGGGSAVVATDYDTQVQPGQAISIPLPLGTNYIAYRSMGGGWFGSASSAIVISEDAVDLSKPNPMRGERVGTTTNDDACTGCVGEFFNVNLLSASAVSITSASAVSVASAVVAAGDYDASGVVCYHGTNGTTTINDIAQGVNTTANTLPSSGDYSYDAIGIASGTEDWCYPTPVVRYKFSSSGTLYLTGKPDYAGGSVTAYGKLRYRRAR